MIGLIESLNGMLVAIESPIASSRAELRGSQSVALIRCRSSDILDLRNAAVWPKKCLSWTESLSTRIATECSLPLRPLLDDVLADPSPRADEMLVENRVQCSPKARGYRVVGVDQFSKLLNDLIDPRDRRVCGWWLVRQIDRSPYVGNRHSGAGRGSLLERRSAEHLSALEHHCRVSTRFRIIQLEPELAS